jgi:FKBP-type peptidyl-prolyl cis-trans isomerase SlyD
VIAEVSPEEGYGVRNEQAIQQVPRQAFQGIENIQPGMQFQARGPQGQVAMVMVVKVDDEFVTVDGNHPLAGVPLRFQVKIVDVREATAEELQHGHVHGAGGVQHGEEGAEGSQDSQGGQAAEPQQPRPSRQRRA